MNLLPAGDSSFVLLDASPDAIVVVGRDWRLSFANRAAARLAGAPREALRGRSLWEAIPALGDARLADQLGPALDGGDAPRWTTPAGDVYDVCGMHHEAGAVLVFRDVTALHSASGSLKEIARRIRAQFAAMPVPTYAWQCGADDLVLVDCNEAAVQATGGAILARLGESAGSFYRDDPAVLEMLRDTLTREEPLRVETDYRLRTSGAMRRLVITFVRADVDLVLVHAMDVTEQRRAEAAMRLSREQQAALLHNIPDHAWLKDAESRYIAVNDALARWLGVAPEAFVGRTDADFYPMEVARRFREQDHQVLETGERQLSEEITMHPAFGMRWFETIKTPYRDASGGFAGTVGIARDITDRKQIEEALRGSEEHLAAIVATQQEVLTAVDLNAVTALVAERARQLTGADAFTVAHVEDDEAVCDVVAGDTWAPPGTRIPLGKSLVGESLRQRTILWASDTETDSRVDLALCRQLAVRSMIVAPVGHDEVPRRLVMVAASTPRRFGEREVRTLEIIAGVLAGAMARAADFSAKQRLVAERTAALEALGQSERWFRSLIENAADPIAIIDADGMLRYASPAFQRVLGYAPDALLGQNALGLLHPDDSAAASAQLELLRAEARGTRSAPARVRHLDGTYRVAEVTASNLLHDTVVGGIVVNLRDVDQQTRLEAQLRQAQKMEAIGQLAGGVAHDFNNLLTVIKCHTQFLREDMGEAHPHTADVQEIERAAARAASLTRQLLAFSRKQILKPRVLDLNAIVGALTPMVRRLIGEDIRVATRLETTGTVLADPGQLEQVLLNLAVNARDAMPRGGTLTIATADVELTPSTARDWLGAEPGAYVVFSLADTGCGMDEETRARIFEPFFTTKEPGKGTGLGLSTVYGIVKQSGGYVWVESAPGLGSTFRIFLPRAEGLVETAGAPAEEPPANGSETVLLVEDEDGVRAIARRVLRERGYTVLEARNGREALQALAQHGAGIELVITDVVMPEMSGHQLAQEVGRRCPAARVLYMTGYTEDEVARRGLTAEGAVLIEKPFSAARLAQAVRQVLDA
ncbi:MAG TPA: PAS domain S-box protein [Gemmatimonadaceae bacterium]|nr:PAS domain S-box protein [Gemmatimonadaceae bacterium]